ncbi:MAG TPA: CHASE2 domain-containing protein, partial [Desulfobacter postgatei]|nr:CHASE2 domain-containing protein [Desulfobacter postgatei]
KPFKEALARFPHMILAAYVNRSGHLVLPASSLGQPPVGHVHIEPGMDGVVRETYHTLILDGKELPSAAFSLYTLLAGDTSVTPDQLKSVDSHGLNDAPLYSILQAQKRRINYYGPPGTFPSISFSDILEKQYPQDYFKNKILVLGLTAAGVDQDHLTCFSQNRNRMPGVELQATILGNILDRSYIRTMGPIRHRILGALFFLVTLLWMSKRSGSRALMTGAALFIGVTGGAFVLLSFFNFWVAPGIFWAGVAGAQVFGHIVHLEIMGQRLVQARQDWQTSFDAIDDAIIIKDKLGQPVLFNRAASYGAMEVLERHGQTENPGPAQLFDPKLDQYFEIQQFYRQGKDGSSAGSVHVVRNITESTRLRQQQTAMQEQLIQSEKMDAIGALAGGIAHDFNNILSAIMGYTQLAQDEIQNNNKAAEHLEKVLKACSRSAELISQILSFSRRSPKERAPLMVGPIVKEVLQLLKATLPPTITLTADPGGNEMVTGDPNQIFQVVLNLCTNAFQAMGNRPGKITVTVKGIEVDRENLVPDLELLPGKYVQISVADTEPGIPEK